MPNFSVYIYSVVFLNTRCIERTICGGAVPSTKIVGKGKEGGTERRKKRGCCTRRGRKKGRKNRGY